MCDIKELRWPPCDPAPFTSVSNESCIIIKAKSEFKVELKQFMNNFGENYNRALAYFYAQEAEQKARKQNKLLTEYIAQLRKYQREIKAGVLDAKRPKAPQQVYFEDPLDCVGEYYSGMVTIGSVSIESDSSIDLEYIEQNGLVSLDTLEILKESSDSRQNLRQISSKNFRRRARIGTFSSEISKSNSVEIISKVSAKSLKSSKPSSKTRQSVQTVKEKLISQSSRENLKGKQHSKQRSSSINLSLTSSDDEIVEKKPISQCSSRNLEEKRNSEMQRSPKQLSLTNSDNEVEVGSDGNISDWSLSDYHTAGEDIPNEITVKENSKAGDEERDAVSHKALSRRHSSTSLATNDTQVTDSDEILNGLYHLIQDLDTKVNLKNEELKDAINSKLPILKAKTLGDVKAMMDEEQNLVNQIQFMRAKLNQLDEVASEPLQLKDFCENLPSAMSPKTVENLFGNNTEKSRRTPKSSPRSQQASSSQLPTERSSKNNLTEQLNQTHPCSSQNFSHSTNFGAPSNLSQAEYRMPPNLGSDNYTRRPPKSFDVSYLQTIISRLMQQQNGPNHNVPINDFPLSNSAAPSQGSMNATCEKIIGKLLHQKGSNEKLNFMRQISITNFNV